MQIEIPAWLFTNEAAPLREYEVSPVPVHIYALLEPETGEPRYVGKSIRPVERLSNHVNEPPSNCHRSHWIQSLKARGLRPTMVILETLEGAWPWQEAERHWIAKGRRLGWRLTNNTDGGDGVPGLAAESVARRNATWKGRHHRPETIVKLKAARALMVTSAATRAKMSAIMRGRVITWKDKLSEAVRKLSVTQEAEVRARLNAGEMIKDLALELGMHRTSISKIKKGTYR